VPVPSLDDAVGVDDEAADAVDPSQA
jgi:hypothetical protein